MLFIFPNPWLYGLGWLLWAFSSHRGRGDGMGWLVGVHKAKGISVESLVIAGHSFPIGFLLHNLKLIKY
jgi:hypothetical protein